MFNAKSNPKLEQLERLRSEDTSHRLMITHTIESYWIQVKRRQSQSYKFKKFAKIAIFLISKRALHATHLLKLLTKMCKYEIDQMSIVEDTERTRFCPQTDRRTNRRTDRRTDGQGDTSIPPFQLRWSGRYNKWVLNDSKLQTNSEIEYIHEEIIFLHSMGWNMWSLLCIQGHFNFCLECTVCNILFYIGLRCKEAWMYHTAFSAGIIVISW